MNKVLGVSEVEKIQDMFEQALTVAAGEIPSVDPETDEIIAELFGSIKTSIHERVNGLIGLGETEAMSILHEIQREAEALPQQLEEHIRPS